MGNYETELEELEKLAESFGSMGEFAHRMTDSYSRLKLKFEDVNSRLARVNELLRTSLAERNRLANYLNNILESLDSGVIVTNAQAAIGLFNGSAEKYTGVKAKDALGHDYFSVLKGNATEEAAEILRGTKNSASGNRVLRRKDGKCIPVAYSLTRLHGDDSSGGMGMVEILYDLTEIRRLEENLKKASTLAALGEMAATVAHEIRNPLSGIAGFTSLLLREMDRNDENRRLVEKIAKGVASLNNIVTNLLDYARSVVPNIVEIDPLPLVKEAVAEFQAGVDDQKKTIEIKAGSRKLVARLDPSLFRQVLINLLKNATQAVGEDGRVQVVLSRNRRGGLKVAVQDDGPGISREARQKLFAPFFTTKASGTGLGLAIVRKLVELQGGKVNGRNRPEGGAVFTVIIPHHSQGETDEGQNSYRG